MSMSNFRHKYSTLIETENSSKQLHLTTSQENPPFAADY